MITDIERNPALPKLGKELLRRLYSKELTYEEFDKECAYWLIEYIDELRWRLVPTPPREVELYTEKRREDLGYTLPRSFWQEPHIAAWKAQDSEVKSKNFSGWYWLNFLKRTIPIDDTVKHLKIDGVIKTYPRFKKPEVFIDRKDWV